MSSLPPPLFVGAPMLASTRVIVNEAAKRRTGRATGGVWRPWAKPRLPPEPGGGHNGPEMRLHPGAVAALWIIAVIGFVVMAAFAAKHDTFPADLWLTHRLQDVDSAAFRHTLRWTEGVGDLPFLPVIWLGAAAAAALWIGRWQGLLVLATMGGRLANAVLKDVVTRPRPSGEMVEVSGHQPSSFSFPSGHAEGAVALYGFIFFLATVYVPNRRLRLLIQAACLWIIVVTGIERVYVGDHWPSDVVGGYYFGALVLGVLVAAERLAPFRRQRVGYSAAAR